MEKLSLEEKALLVSGKGEWQTHGVEGKVREICLTDGPYGVRKLINLSGSGSAKNTEFATCYPTTVTMASSWDRALIYELGKHLGTEAAEHGVDVILGPGINIKRSPLCGRNFEYYSEDPFLTGCLATEMVRGIQACGVGATVKHFAVNNREYARQVMNAFADERTLREIYLKAFEMVIKNAQPYCVMCSYNAVNGTFMSENSYLLDEILRKEFGFDGVIMSDWLAVNDRIKGIKAGLDLEMPESKYNTERIIDSVKNGDLSEEELNLCASRVCRLTEKCNPQAAQLDESHEEFAKKALDRSAVLMKNDGMLPMRKDDSVLVIGAMAENPRYQGGGSAHVRVRKMKNFLEKLSEESVSYQYAPGYTMKGNGKNICLINEAVKAAEKYEKIIVFLGLPEHFEIEGFDRAHLELPKGQLELMKRLEPYGDRCTVVLSCGSAVRLPFADKINGLLHMQLGGQMFSDSAFDLLYGRINPSGRLTETYPKCFTDNPVNASFDASHRYAVYTEGMFVGYRYYDKIGLKTAYPFGFGLSYTDFSYGEMKHRFENNKIIFYTEIKNVGNWDGEEVVQLYVSKPKSDVTRAVKELIGFTKLFIKKGETKIAEVGVETENLAIYDIVLKRKIIEDGDYLFSFAKDAETVLQSQTVHIDGEIAKMGKTDFYEKMTRDTYIDEKTYDTLLPQTVVTAKERIKACKELNDNSSISDYVEHFPHCFKFIKVKYLHKKHRLNEVPIRRIEKMKSKNN